MLLTISDIVGGHCSVDRLSIIPSSPANDKCGPVIAKGAGVIAQDDALAQNIAYLAPSFISPQTSRPLKSRRKPARSPCPLQSRSLDLGKLVYREARCMTRTLFPVAVSMSRAGGTRSPSIATMKTRCVCNNKKVPLS